MAKEHVIRTLEDLAKAAKEEGSLDLLMSDLKEWIELKNTIGDVPGAEIGDSMTWRNDGITGLAGLDVSVEGMQSFRVDL